MRKFLKGFLIVLSVLLALFIVYAVFGLDNDLKTQKYTLQSPKIYGNLRFAVVADLHSSAYGDGQKTLLSEIDAQSPDAVFLLGDIYDRNDKDEDADDFLREIGSRYPCYYVSGNHEYQKKSGRDINEVFAYVENCGITVLRGDFETLTIRETTVNICGLTDYFSDKYDPNETPWLDQLEAVSQASNNGAYTILLTHRPSRIGAYNQGDFDLVLCGHAHGGQWRLPGVFNGLMAPDEGIFPKYAGGKYALENETTMIVSRGLAKDNTWVPRLYNPPELVIIDLTPETK